MALGLAREFWRRMNTNDWSDAAKLFADDIEILWPQSGEKIVSAADFTALNTAYPAEGRWSFSVIRAFGDEKHAFTETEVTDGAVRAVSVSVFESEGDFIKRIIEYWPEAYPAPAWRAQWVKPL